MKHSLACLMWRWRREAARVEVKLQTGAHIGGPPWSERGFGEAQGYARALRNCAAAVERTIARAARKGAA